MARAEGRHECWQEVPLEAVPTHNVHAVAPTMGSACQDRRLGAQGAAGRRCAPSNSDHGQRSGAGPASRRGRRPRSTQLVAGSATGSGPGPLHARSCADHEPPSGPRSPSASKIGVSATERPGTRRMASPPRRTWEGRGSRLPGSGGGAERAGAVVAGVRCEKPRTARSAVRGFGVLQVRGVRRPRGSP